MRVAFILIALSFLAFPVSAHDDHIHRALDANDTCPVDLPDWATPSETYAWVRICTGQIANMNFATGANDNAGCDAPDETEKWPEQRQLSARFIKLISTRAPYIDAPARPEVRIRCAVVPDRIDLDYEVIPQALWITHSRLQEGLTVVNAQFGSDLSLWGSALGNAGLYATGLSVDGDLYLSWGQFSFVYLIHAKIAGHLIAEGSEFSENFSAIRISVAGDLDLGGEGQFAGIDLRDARIGHSLWLGSWFGGEVDLSGAVIGELMLTDWEVGVAWRAGARLDLSNATAKSLFAWMPESWMREDDSRLPIKMSGFRYDRLGDLTGRIPRNLELIDTPALIEWLQAPLPDGLDQYPEYAPGYAPQPYQQLEATLRGMGAEEPADEVANARHLHRMATRGDNWLGWSGDLALRWLVGFGLHPFRVLWWFGGLVVLGWAVARWCSALRPKGLADCGWYSLENALPLVELSQDHQAVRHENVWVRSFFHFQKVTGFLLATVLVGALTLLGG